MHTATTMKSPIARKPHALVCALFLPLALAACEPQDVTTVDAGTNGDAGPMPPSCPGPLLEAAQTCTGASCDAGTGTRLIGEADLASEKAKSWVVPVWASSEIANEMTNIEYTKEVGNALVPSAGRRARESSVARARAFLGDAAFEAIYGPARAARVRAEAAIRAEQRAVRVDLTSVFGTAIRARSILPRNARAESTACSKVAPSCGTTSLCVIPEGQTNGTCSGTLTLKFRSSGSQFTEVPSTVRKVGRYGAIVVDDAATASLTTADSDELLDRFERHIAVTDHAFFGTPGDRDGNGVVILFITPKVVERGAELAGFFQKDDLLPTSMAPASNAAEILYMQAPNASITLDQLSGTIGHEYQHLINFYAKNAQGPSQGEDAWLDEGLATFAEDVLGYGSDAFKNVAAYLGGVDQISLTGNGNCPDGSSDDSTCRRGMAHLLVRYYFEQKGGASFGSGPGELTDKGGVAAVKNLVQSSDTGTLLFTAEGTGRSFDVWLGDLITTVAVDGAGYEGVSCNPKYSLLAPEASGYTHYQRGIDLRTPFTAADGMRIELKGPNTATLETESIPLPANAGEIRTVSVASGQVKISVGGSVDYKIGFHALPASK